MKNILVSGASGIVGYGILRSLKRTNKPLRLIGTTIYDDSVAQGFSDIFEQAPLTNNDEYLGWLLTLIRKHEIDFLIPGIEADMYKWSENIAEIEKSGAVILLNNADLIGLCKDKWVFYESLCIAKSPYAIESSLIKDFDQLVNKYGLPFLLKPRRGYGSKGIVIVGDECTFLEHLPKIGSLLIAQPIIGNENEEFTTSAFCDGIGDYYCFMTLKRKLSKDGFTEKAEVVNLEGMDVVLKELCNYYKPVGPTNFQFRKQDGVFKLLEINPRISSSTSIRCAFGYNESQMSVEYYLENKKPVQPLVKLGKAVRYVEDYIFYL
jgi:carbamoyl-phosphate synthase large subunit